LKYDLLTLKMTLSNSPSSKTPISIQRSYP